MNASIRIFKSPNELAEKFAEELIAMVAESASEKKFFTVALSGGSTPELLYSILGDHFSQSAQWEYVHFFWGDERCVPADDPQSNFGMTSRVFLEKISIPDANIHRIIGENDPDEEAVRYSDEIKSYTPERGGLPVFDLVILGLGEDGHTASIFPDNIRLLNSEKICEVAVHPVSSQKRITVTGRVINNAGTVIFLVNGAGKAKLVSEIIDVPLTVEYPAVYIKPKYGMLKWYFDLDASKMISKATLLSLSP